MFRMRFFKDGKDFSSAGVRMAQSKNRVVFALAMLTDRGDWHIGLDRPADNKFTFSSLALRFELAADDAELADSRTMVSGGHKVVVHGLPGTFDSRPIQWRSGRESDRVWVEASLYDGPETHVVFDETLRTIVGGGVEILPAGAVPSAEPQLVEEGDSYQVRWGELAVCNCVHALPYE